ncbi:Synaptosomal-associated protein 23 [Kappamyces sp. JEL0680]|nr:Synaptosomal-associated protein 23 [Kappamyces sp. JEL0680]
MYAASASKNKAAPKIGLRSNARNSGEATDDVLDSLIKETLEQQEETADLTNRIAVRVAATEQIAAESLTTLNAQGETLNQINRKIDGLDENISDANKDASYLKALTGSIFIPVAAPKKTDASILSKLQFSNTAPKDKNGRPIAPPRITSLTVGNMDREKRKDMSSQELGTVSIGLDESATAEQQERSKRAEEQIDQNLHYVSKGLGNLKQAAITMGDELQRQTEVAERINDKTDNASSNLDRLNAKVSSLMKIKKKAKKAKQ